MVSRLCTYFFNSLRLRWAVIGGDARERTIVGKYKIEAPNICGDDDV
jgi:hypothetical protein